MSDQVTNIKDLTSGVTYEILLRSGTRFRGRLAQSWEPDGSDDGRSARFELRDNSERSVYTFEFVSATPVA